MHCIHQVRPELPAITKLISTRYVLDIGQSEDWLALQIALLPCLIGYGIIARQLYDDPNTLREGNKYWKWIETYVAEDYLDAMQVGRGTTRHYEGMVLRADVPDLIETHAGKQSSSRIDELARIFIHATNVSVRTGTLTAHT
jgi:thiaminase